MTVKRSVALTGFAESLPETLRANLISHGTRKRFANGQVIRLRGDAAREFWIVEDGAVHIGRFTASGNFLLFLVVGPGDSFGEVAFLGNMSRTVDLVAAADTVLIEIAERQLTDLLRSSEDAARIMLKTLARTIKLNFDLLEHGRGRTGIQRLSAALHTLCGSATAPFTISVKQQELADLVGLSRVSLGKALRVLEQRGIAKRGYGQIEVLDLAALSEQAGNAADA